MADNLIDFYMVKFVDDAGLCGWQHDTVLISGVEYFSRAYADWEENRVDRSSNEGSGDGRIDPGEGLLAIPDVSTDRFMRGFPRDFRAAVQYAELRDMTEVRRYGLLCFYSFLTRNDYHEFMPVPPEVEKLGPWAIIIFDKNKFIRMLHEAFVHENAFSAERRQMAMGGVNYQNRWNIAPGIAHLFKKREQFMWQREFRFVFRLASAAGETVKFPEKTILSIPRLHEAIKIIPTVDLLERRIHALPRESPITSDLWKRFGHDSSSCELKPGRIGFKARAVIA